MQGIERITEQILARADAAAKEILDEAEAFETKMNAESEDTYRSIINDARESAEREAAMTIRRGESLAGSEKRKKHLAHRQATAEDVIARALHLLSSEPDERRVVRYASWVRALNIREGVITLAEHEQHLKAPLGDALGDGSFSFSEEVGRFSGGIVVQHGRVTDNLTYDLVVRDHRPELTRLIFDELRADAEDEPGGLPETSGTIKEAHDASQESDDA